MDRNKGFRYSALKTLIAAVVTLLSSVLCGQQVAWVKHYGTPLTHVGGFKLSTDAAGNIYGTGSLGDYELVDFDGNSSPVQGNQDIIIAKWDSSGTNQWVRTVGGVPVQNDWDQGEFIRYVPTGDRIVVWGTYNSYANFGPDQFSEQNDQRSIFMASYLPDGNCAWARAVRGAAVYNSCPLVDGEGNIYWFGQAILGSPQFVGYPSITLPYGGFVARYDPDGNLQNARRILKYGGVKGVAWADSSHWLLSIAAVQGEELFGVDLGITEEACGILALVDTAGSVIWFKRHEGSNGYGNGSGGCAVIGDHALVSGVFGGEMTFEAEVLSSSPAWSRMYLASYSLSGEPEWIRSFASNVQGSISLSVPVDSLATIYLLGGYSDTLTIGPIQALPAGESSSFLARFDTLGNCLSAFYFGPSTGSLGSVALSNGRLVVSAPYTGDVGFGPTMLPASNSVMLAKLDTMSGYTGVGRVAQIMEEELVIYANPNNGLCTVKLPTHIRFTNGLLLSIFDGTGALVQRLPVTVGTTGVQVDIQAQAKGIYHVELGDGEQRYSGSIVFE
jgi:hypothetical protein